MREKLLIDSWGSGRNGAPKFRRVGGTNLMRTAGQIPTR